MIYETFYVIWNAASNTYRNSDGEFGPYAEVERFPVIDDCVVLESHEKFIGPYAEWETP